MRDDPAQVGGDGEHDRAPCSMSSSSGFEACMPLGGRSVVDGVERRRPGPRGGDVLVPHRLHQVGQLSAGSRRP